MKHALPCLSHRRLRPESGVAWLRLPGVSTLPILTAGTVRLLNSETELAWGRLGSLSSDSELASPRLGTLNPDSELASPRLSGLNSESELAWGRLGPLNPDSELASPRLSGLNSDSELAWGRLGIVSSDSELTRGSEVKTTQAADFQSLTPTTYPQRFAQRCRRAVNHGQQPSTTANHA